MTDFKDCCIHNFVFHRQYNIFPGICGDLPNCVPYDADIPGICNIISKWQNQIYLCPINSIRHMAIFALSGSCVLPFVYYTFNIQFSKR